MCFWGSSFLGEKNRETKSPESPGIIPRNICLYEFSSVVFLLLLVRMCQLEILAARRGLRKRGVRKRRSKPGCGETQTRQNSPQSGKSLVCLMLGDMFLEQFCLSDQGGNLRKSLLRTQIARNHHNPRFFWKARRCPNPPGIPIEFIISAMQKRH